MNNKLALSQLHSNSKLISEYSSLTIINKYKEVYGIDVAEYFEGIPQIQLREENSTGYQFFYPFSIAGDAAFYKELQKIPWYYADWKWEYDIALNLIGEGKKILEIGCGKGAFLNKLKETCECVGLELNDEAEKKEYNVTILNQTIEIFALKSPVEYDWVISFQVLEHIADIHSFITNSLKVLKKDGQLLIAVPNNGAKFFNTANIKFENHEYLKALLLNMPPHHMGRWDLKVFTEIQKVYDMELVSHKSQAAQSWRKELNISIIVAKYNGILKKVVRRLLNKNIIYNLLSKVSPQYRYGDCILVVFRKK